MARHLYADIFKKKLFKAKLDISVIKAEKPYYSSSLNQFLKKFALLDYYYDFKVGSNEKLGTKLLTELNKEVKRFEQYSIEHDLQSKKPNPITNIDENQK
jgi:hypothetical protein